MFTSFKAIIATTLLALSICPIFATSDYAVVISAKTKQDPAWNAVAQELISKHQGKLITFKDDIGEVLPSLKSEGTRYMAIVAKPEELDRTVVSGIHRMTRQIFDDPYGNCLWGLVTGFSADDAMRIAKAKDPLIVTRMEGSTNVDSSRFADSMCVTDWGPFETMEQTGYTRPEKKPFPQTAEGMIVKFAEYWAQKQPQLLVTSAHATQYNLEMPFSKGLIVSNNNQFHVLIMPHFPQFARLLSGALFAGKESDITDYLAQIDADVMQPRKDPVNDPAIWLAAGNCLFGDAKRSKNTMVITALSAYGCNQVCGYTVPSWYGAGGWGTLSAFLSNHNQVTFAQAWHLNNQKMIARTLKEFPGLINVEYNGVDIQREMNKLAQSIMSVGIRPDKDALGLVHDRDVMAFYGDPKWQARLDESHAPSPWNITWNKKGDTLTLTANHKLENAECAVWFNERKEAKEAAVTMNGQPMPGVETVVNRDFILLYKLSAPQGGKVEILFK